MRVNQSALEFFLSLPDDVLIEIALNDWESLEKLCSSLSLDLQLMEESYESSSNRRNVC